MDGSGSSVDMKTHDVRDKGHYESNWTADQFPLHDTTGRPLEIAATSKSGEIFTSMQS